MPQPRVVSVWLAALALACAALLCSRQAQALTIASFADPTVGGSPVKYMFQVRDGTPGKITQPADSPTVTLSINKALDGGGDYKDVAVVYPELSYTGSFLGGATIGQGYFEFVQQKNKNQKVTVLRIDFDSAYVTRSNVGGDDVFSASNVRFTILGEPVEFQNDKGSFAFSFGNQKVYPGTSPTTGFDATAAFTCSGNLTPEPGTIALLAAGAGWLTRRRRRI